MLNRPHLEAEDFNSGTLCSHQTFLHIDQAVGIEVKNTQVFFSEALLTREVKSTDHVFVFLRLFAHFASQEQASHRV